MVTLYKLTDGEMMTFRGFKWRLGVPAVPRYTHRSSYMCGPGILHAYRGPELALMCNYLHANIPRPRLFVAVAPNVIAEDGAKVGVHKLTLTRELMVPAAAPMWGVAARMRDLAHEAARAFNREAEWLTGDLPGRHVSASPTTTTLALTYRRYAEWAYDVDPELATFLLPPIADLAMQAMIEVTGKCIDTGGTQP